MVELSLLASAAPRGIFPHQDSIQQQLGGACLCRPSSKDFQMLSPGHLSASYGFTKLRSPELVDPWSYKNFSSDYNQLSSTVTATSGPAFIDVQDAYLSLARFGLGVAAQYDRHEKISQFLMSGSEILDGENINVCLLSDNVGFHTLILDECQCRHATELDDFCLYEFERSNLRSSSSLIYPCMGFYPPRPVLDCNEGLPCNSIICKSPDGQMLFMGTEAELGDLHSVVTEFFLSNNPRSGSKRQTVVPYFRRSGSGARARNMIARAPAVAPAKRPETVKLKPSRSKKERKTTGKERDIYRRNSFHACESLLSLVLENNRGGKTAIESLKKSGPEISNLLTQCSAAIAGTGLAILFSVVWKITSGKVPLGAPKLLNTGLALGLVWLSAAVNRLRDNFISLSRKPNKTQDEIGREVEESMQQIFVRAMTLMAVAMLRFA